MLQAFITTTLILFGATHPMAAFDAEREQCPTETSYVESTSTSFSYAQAFSALSAKNGIVFSTGELS